MFNNNLYKLVCFPCFRLFGFCSYKVISTVFPPPDAVPLAYSEYVAEETGSNTESPIYIIHGILGSRSNWNSVAKRIAAKTNRKVVTVDLRNHGDSPHTKEFSYSHMVLDLKRLMEEQNIEEGKASFVGHSIGGRAAMALALENPTAIRDLVIVDISPTSIPESIKSVPRLLQAIDAVRLTPGPSLIEARRTADEQMKRYIRGEKLRHWLLKNLILDEKTNMFVWKINVQSVQENFLSLLPFPTFENVFDRPCLFIAGEESNYLKKEDEEEIKQLFPQASFQYVEAATQIVHNERITIFLQIICDFFDKSLNLTE